MWKSTLFFALCLLTGSVSAASPQRTYLQTHRQDLRGEIRMPSDEVCIWGFGALHGSAKTEETELRLLENLLKMQDTIFYFPETDFSTAHYFQRYLDTGDEALLRDVIASYGVRIPQERSVEVYEKWRELRRLSTGKTIRVIGTDPIAAPKYALIYLLDLVSDPQWKYRPVFDDFLQHSENYSRTDLVTTVGTFLDECSADTVYYRKNIADPVVWRIVTEDLSQMIHTQKREPAIFSNYLRLDSLWHFRRHPQFVRMGVFHIYKGRENNYPSFFARLIESGTYRKTEIFTIQGFLTQSRVLWDTAYDRNGQYTGYSTKGGFGISDCWREHFRGISHLKRNSISDMTLFDLRRQESPYKHCGQMELIQLRQLFGKKYVYPEGSCSLDYIDAAVLIRESKANHPLEEIDKRTKL